MMEGDPFELSFKIPDTDEHRLIPELLPSNEPAHGIETAESLCVQFHYKFLPAGLIPRFIVRMHNVLGAGDAWKNGVVVKVDDRRVLVRGVREERRVFVSVQGREPASRRALAIVRQNLDMVHRTMKHLEVTEHVALSRDPGVTVSYRDLLQYEAEEGSAHRFRPQGAADKYSIRELLDGIEDPEWRSPPTITVTMKADGVDVRRDHGRRIMGTFDGQVFVSYANEPDPSHARLVRELADKLREQGVDALIDQYLGEMGPGICWPLWMKQQVEKSRVVLMVCSPAYLRRVEGNEAPGRGLGATFEGKLVRQEMYNNGVVNVKYRPVLMSADHTTCIPLDLQGATHFRLYEPGGYDRLYRALTGQPSIVAPPLGKPIIMPPT
ncbi:hypothetical protein PHYC_03885 [Phycisphaerales bacterium]|nr:hypothetical protein PHYC_03885 [Phycisphaerales bacterium]